MNTMLQTKLPVWALLAPALLVFLYGFLIIVALGDQSNFYDAMNMPMPNHGFMHISWTGKTIAIWVMLAAAAVTRQAGLLLVALLGVVIQQIGDFTAAAMTGVDVNITRIGFALWVISIAAIGLAVYRSRRQLSRHAAP